jgi:sigma-70-like protein
LPTAQADALRLRFFGGLKFEEIADAMQCSLGTAKNRVRWGLMRLADHVHALRNEADAASQTPERRGEISSSAFPSSDFNPEPLHRPKRD